MVSLSASDIARLCGGSLRSGGGSLRSGGGDLVLSHFELDSRRVTPGGLFVCIRGERADGHDHWPDAAAHGAAAAITSRDLPVGIVPQVEIRVEDTALALRRLAAAVRAARDWTVIGITGSVGKTTTKELAFMALGGRARAARSPGNFNNLFGLPLAILNAPEVSALVLEMGISTPGEMAALAALARPEIAVITAIAATHTEFLGDEAGVLREKRNILGTAGQGGARVLVYNHDDARLRELANTLTIETIGCGFTEGAQVRGIEFTQRDGHLELRADYRGAREAFALSGAGRALALDLLLALGVASACGISAADAQAGLGYYQPGPGRGQLVPLAPGIRALDESYNASPAAIRESFATLQELAQATGARRRIAVLGDMFELGARAPALHAELAVPARAANVDLLLGCGPLMRGLCDSFSAAGGAARHYDSAEAAGADARTAGLLAPGDLLLLKGSRGMRVEKFIPAYTGSAPGTSGKGGGAC